jgi:ParB/RepB/Spo0J family partition protein
LTAAIAEVPKEKAVIAPPHAMPPLDSNSASQNIPVSLILRSPFNRKPEVSDDFVANVRQFGVLQPVLVRPVKLGLDRINDLPQSARVEIGKSVYELVAGERRWLASKKNGLSSIPAVIRNLTNAQVMEIQIAENDQREDYSFMDRSEAYARLRNEYMLAHKGEKGWTEEKCMDLIASNCQNDKIKGRTVQQIIALGKLTMECQVALRKGEIEASHGYELCRRPAEEQGKLLLWIRQQTHHSQGDIPSVRRLKLEIRNLEIAAEEARRQETLFKPPQPGTSTTKVPTVDDQLYAKALEVVREAKLHRMNDPLFLERNLKILPAAAHQLFVRLEKEGIVTPRNGLSERSYIFPKKPADCDHMGGAPAQTSAPDFFRKDGKVGDEKLYGGAKPPTEAQLKKEADRAANESREFNRRQDEHERNERIEKEYRGLFFAALAKKTQINSRLLTHVVPTMIFEIWENELPIEAFAQEVLLWPAPKDAHAYSYAEVQKYSVKHTRKFTGGLLAAMILTLYMNEAETEKIARYMGVDPKKLRWKAAMAVKKEDEQEKLKAKGQKPKAGVKA